MKPLILIVLVGMLTGCKPLYVPECPEEKRDEVTQWMLRCVESAGGEIERCLHATTMIHCRQPE